MIERADSEQARQQVIDWFERAVLGLDLCPFASRPWRQQAIRFVVSEAGSEVALLQDLEAELQYLDEHPETETTLLIVTGLLGDFEDYNEFLDPAEQLLAVGGWEGIYQIASFHPRYRFADSRGEEDAADWTNRSPWPLLHLLREESLEQALAHHPNPEAIPSDNARRLRGLDRSEMRALFGARIDASSD